MQNTSLLLASWSYDSSVPPYITRAFQKPLSTIGFVSILVHSFSCAIARLSAAQKKSLLFNVVDYGLGLLFITSDFRWKM